MARDPRPRTRVTLVQFATALLMFAVLSVLGGVLVAGLVLPLASVATDAAEGVLRPVRGASADTWACTTLAPAAVEHLRPHRQAPARDLLHAEPRRGAAREDLAVDPEGRVAVEDKRFWDHNGVDGQGIVRAMYINFTSSSQPWWLHAHAAADQEHPLAERGRRRTTRRQDQGRHRGLADPQDSRMAPRARVRGEGRQRSTAPSAADDPKVNCGKEQVLEQYFNIAQFGSQPLRRRGRREVYFGKHASQLNALEAATIAGITQNPSRWDPLKHPMAAQQRRNVVLFTMYEQHMITLAEYKVYRATSIESTLDPHKPKFSCAAAAVAPFFCDYVTKIISKDPVFNTGDVKGQRPARAGRPDDHHDARLQQAEDRQPRAHEVHEVHGQERLGDGSRRLEATHRRDSRDVPEPHV